MGQMAWKDFTLLSRIFSTGDV